MDHAFEVICGLCGLIITVLSGALVRIIGTYDKALEKQEETIEDFRLQLHECDNRLSILESQKRY